MQGIARRSLMLAFAGLPWLARAQPVELTDVLPNAKLQGQGHLTFFGLKVYSAKLWVTEGFRADDFGASPLALELEYARALVGKLIAERSLAEMKKVGEVSNVQAERWLAAMTSAFPNLDKGDRITGVYGPAAGMRFFFNGRLCGEVRDADFAKLFVGIWLSPRSSEPKLRLTLLGGA